jgi:flagellar biosynthesis protein
MSDEKPDERKMAAAIKYDPKKDRAPSILAKGFGIVAEKIIEKAREYNIPILSDPDLVKALTALDIAKEIPPELYEAVAQVLAFLYKINAKSGGLEKRPG